MPSMGRSKTNYCGVYFIWGKAIGTDKPEKIYYIIYRREGKLPRKRQGVNSQMP